MRRAPCFSCAIVTLALATAVHAQCPTSSGTCITPTPEPVGFGYCQPRFSGPLSQQFDLRQGLFEVTGHGQGSYSGYSTLIVEDDFMIGGVGPEDTVRCQVRVEIQGQIGCFDGGFAGVACTLRDPEGASAEYVERIESTPGEPSPYLPIQTTRTLDVAWVGALPHRLHVELAVSGRSGGGSATARYRFIGLPPTATLSSCRGFVNESPTPARPSSWGALRLRYR